MKVLDMYASLPKRYQTVVNKSIRAWYKLSKCKHKDQKFNCWVGEGRSYRPTYHCRDCNERLNYKGRVV